MEKDHNIWTRTKTSQMTLRKEVQGQEQHTGPGRSSVGRIYLTLFTPEAYLAVHQFGGFI
jgi:hypothetical protein